MDWRITHILCGYKFTHLEENFHRFHPMLGGGGLLPHKLLSHVIEYIHGAYGNLYCMGENFILLINSVRA